MNKIRKAAKLAAFTLLAAASLLFIKPIRAWATVEGAWLHNLFMVQGPVYIYKSRIGGAVGLRISTGTYAGSSQSGVPAAPTGTTDLIIEGGQASAALTAAASAEGHLVYDPTVHSIAFSDGTKWHKLVYTAATGADAWTSY